MSKTNVERTLETLVEFADLNRKATINLTSSIDALGERMAQSNRDTNATIDRLGMKIDDLAVQIGHQAQSIGRLEQSIRDLSEETREQHEIARIQSQNVAELIRTVQQLTITRG